MSGHRNPQVQVEALRRFPFDSMLVALSALDHFILSFAEEFLPVANAKGVAVIGMKVMALAKLEPYYERALRYTMGLPISTTIVGMETMDQLKRNLAVARFTPRRRRSWSSTGDHPLASPRSCGGNDRLLQSGRMGEA
jgi:aryl-alcohol dehydrogenase-like predicted oxidoreductase